MIAAARHELTPEAIRDADNRHIGHLNETVRKLEAEVAKLTCNDYHADQYKKLCQHRIDLAEWLVDQATSNGKQTKFTVDAALGGEDFIPNSFTRIVNGKKYAFELVSTVYSIKESD